MELIGPYLFLPFAVLLVLGVPIAFSLGLASAFFLFFSGTTIPRIVLVTEMYTAVDSFALLALPMFVLTGELLNRCQLTERLIDVARLLVGWIKGGLAHVNVVTSMFFAGISGSVLADAASIGPILIPAMIKERYPRAFSAAITGASAVIGAIIPPSIPLIIVGGQLQISIGGLFAAGLVPGILVGLFLMIVAYVICRRNDYGTVHRFEKLAPATTSAVKAVPALLIPLFILWGILSGVFTPTEAGAAAVAYTLVIGTVLYRTLTRDKLVASLIATARVTASVLLILASAVVFSRLLTFYRVPQEILDLLLAITDNRVLLLLIIIVFFLVVGTFMDALGQHDHPRAAADARRRRRTRHAPSAVRRLPDGRPAARRPDASAGPGAVRRGAGGPGIHRAPVRRGAPLPRGGTRGAGADRVRAGRDPRASAGGRSHRLTSR